MRSGMQVDQDVNMSLSEINLRTILADSPASANHHSIDADIDLISFKKCTRCPDGRQNATPIGILTEHRALEQVAA
jgi:hypothetical protein